MKTALACVLIVGVLYGASCDTMNLQASAECVAALSALGIAIAGGTQAGFDLSSVLALLAANGGNISDAVRECSAVFMARTGTDLASVVATKVTAVKTKSATPYGQAIPIPHPAVKVKIR